MITNALVLMVLSGSTISQAWKASAGDWSGSTPLVAASGDNVLFDTYQDLRLVRASDGKLVKKISKGTCLGAAIDLKVDSGVALLLCEAPGGEGSKTHELHSTLAAIDLKTGKTQWTREGSIPAPVALEGALVIFADKDRIVAVDLTMGKPVWSGKAGAGRFGLSANGKLIAVASDSSVYAISLGDGVVKWSAPLQGSAHAAPLVWGENIYLVHDPAGGDVKKQKAEGNRLTAFNTADSKPRWKRDFKGELLFFQPVIVGDTVLVVGMGEEVTDGHLWALKQATGEVMWSVPWRSDANGHDFRPIAMGEVMLAWGAVPKPLGAYELFAFDPASGAVKWSYAPTTDEKFSFSRPLPVGPRIVYGDGDTVRGLTIKAAK